MDAGLREAGWLSSRDIGGTHTPVPTTRVHTGVPLPLSQAGSRGLAAPAEGGRVGPGSFPGSVEARQPSWSLPERCLLADGAGGHWSLVAGVAHMGP